MKVKCLTREEADKDDGIRQIHQGQGWYEFLTPNKLYDVIEIGNIRPNHTYYLIIADDDNYRSVTTKLFEPLRNINLDKLLI